jgi:hypothetical protein
MALRDILLFQSIPISHKWLDANIFAMVFVLITNGKTNK